MRETLKAQALRIVTKWNDFLFEAAGRINNDCVYALFA